MITDSRRPRVADLRPRLAVLLLAGLALTTAVPVAAQGISGEIVGGYQFMRDNELETNFPAGWFAGVGVNLTEQIALIGEIAGSHRRETETIGLADFSASFNVYTYLGGVRARFLTDAPIVPFVQFLVGAARATASVDLAGVELDESLTKAAVQPGGGVDIPLSDRLAARLMVDYRRIFVDEGDGNEIRVAAGVVFGFGN